VIISPEGNQVQYFRFEGGEMMVFARLFLYNLVLLLSPFYLAPFYLVFCEELSSRNITTSREQDYINWASARNGARIYIENGTVFVTGASNLNFLIDDKAQDRKLYTTNVVGYKITT
jgi:hypothetical protein